MQVKQVSAIAFGAMRNATLTLTPGLNVIGGPNEAGKSTWSAAIRAALTGVRRGKGRRNAHEVLFEQLHRPWDKPDEWKVAARLVLDDGREIDLLQDLGDKVDSRATDVGLGRDVSQEIIGDGSPDASRWLGLDRETFPRTVWVGQGDILSVANEESADLLQDYLQRAAATHEADTTAAEALGRLEEFRHLAIGTDAASTRPLRAAMDGLALAKARLRKAREDHSQYMVLLGQAEEARLAYEAAALECRTMHAAIAAGEASHACARAQRVAQLAGKYPTRPASALERDELSDRVAAALEGWSKRPSPSAPAGPSAKELSDEVAALPDVPVGDREPDIEVDLQQRALATARGVLAALDEGPPVPNLPAAGGLSEADLRQTAAGLEIDVPGVSEAMERQRASLERRVLDLAVMPWSAVAGVVVGVVLGVIGVATATWILVVVAGVISAVAIVVWARRLRALSDARQMLDSVRNELAPLERDRSVAQARRLEALKRAEAAGLAPEPASLLRLADEVRAHDLAVRGRDSWRERCDEATAAVALAEDALRRSLEARGYPAIDGGVDHAYAAYVEACRDRSDRAARASRRDALEKALRSRQDADAAYLAATAQRDSAERALRAVALEATGAESGIPQELVAGLERWQADRARIVGDADQAQAEWQELQALLQGRDVAQVQEDAAAMELRAAELAHGLLPGIADAVAAPTVSSLGALEERERQSLALKETTEARRAALAESMADVADAEEEVLHFEDDLQRLQALAAVVGTTIDLLRAAEERVHRDIAPVLAGTVRQHLPAITSGRYVDAAVDPADLGVKVKEASSGQWRPGWLLSQGTREQIYLLLRVAMAEHVATRTEKAPLFLDEVTAQSDSIRLEPIMTAIRGLARERQIVVFTHDRAIIDWTQRHLDPTRDQVIWLEAPAA